MLIEVIDKGPVPYSEMIIPGDFSDISMLIYVRKMHCLRYMWTEIPLIWVQLCVIYYTFLELVPAEIDYARSASKIIKLLLSL